MKLYILEVGSLKTFVWKLEELLPSIIGVLEEITK
jgi:hypothetical protein